MLIFTLPFLMVFTSRHNIKGSVATLRAIPTPFHLSNISHYFKTLNLVYIIATHPSTYIQILKHGLSENVIAVSSY